MKVAISSMGKSIEDNVSDVFGRCPYFIIAEIADQKIGETEALKNQSACQTGGAGISTAQLMAEKDVNAVITGNMGPKALDVLGQFKITVYTGNGIIKDVLQKFIEKKLKEITK